MAYKVFQNGTALTAEVMNDFIQEQTIARFTNATERNNAIPAPEAGQHVWLASTNQTLRYDGTSWVELLPAVVSGLAQRTTVVCTSTTRPAQAAGRLIYETDTKRYWSSDGTSWTYINGGTNPYTVELTLAGGWYHWDGGFARLTVVKTPGLVSLSGLVGNTNAFSQPALVATVPAGYRPATTILAGYNLNGAFMNRLDISNVGQVNIIPSSNVPAGNYHGINISWPTVQ